LITNLNKIYPENKSIYKYLFCIVDHFSKYAKTYLMETKTAFEVLDKLKNYIKEIGKPEIIQSDKGW